LVDPKSQELTRPVVLGGTERRPELCEGEHDSGSAGPAAALGASLNRSAPGLFAVPTVAIAIAIAIAITIATASAAKVDPVTDHAEDIHVYALEGPQGVAEVPTFSLPNPQDKQCAVRLLREDRCIGHQEHWRRIEEHEVVLLSEPVEQLVESPTPDHLCGVGRRSAADEDIEAVNPTLFGALFNTALAHHDVDESLSIVHAE